MPKKTVLLNATLSSISIYFMSVLLLPQWVIDGTDTIKKKLWNGADPSIRKIHHVNWAILCRPKSKDRLGILNLKIQN
jgi:hypothetical protein